jgi:cytochrome c553
LKIFLTVLLLSLSLFGEDKLYQKGEELYFSKGCLSCHGTEADGLHSYPSLAKRSKWDLKRRLLKFRAGVESSQRSLLMIPFARELSDYEIEAVSYFLENIESSDKGEKYSIPFESWGDGGS